jgi:NAD+ synthase (glutamine-hydrolysing)
MNWSEFGYSRVSAIIPGALTPTLKLGQPLFNADLLVPEFKRLSSEGASVVITPELVLTGYTCEDLFHSETLIVEAEQGLKKIVDASQNINTLWIVGAPLRMIDGRLLNCAYAIHRGKILGAVPKIALPNMGEFYERRWFVSGRKVNEVIHHALLGEFLVSPNQIFAAGPIRVGIEVCQDLWTPNEPSVALALKGATLIVNISASNETVGKAKYRKKMVEVQSRKLHCAYFYVSAGMYESSKDTVFSGHTFAAELGEVVAEIEPFYVGKTSLTVDFDFERILNARTKDICFLEEVEDASHVIAKTVVHAFAYQREGLDELNRTVEPYPFLAEIPDFEDVVLIQASGLLRRVQSAGSKSMIIGISGGLDSTLALYIALRAKGLQGKLPSGEMLKVIGVTLPGPGTSDKTLQYARTLLEETGVDQTIEVSISAAVEQHMKDLGKDQKDRSVVYENAQARERTQILFNLANEHQGTVVGTGDLSELALGWCTFNADHMAHYAVNSGIPKTVIKGLVGYWSEIAATRLLRNTLSHILALPISPELLPPNEAGEIAQETEALIGSYDLHDFFIYHFLNHGFSKEKIRALAMVAFANDHNLLTQIDGAIEIFFKRFFSQQFKRSTLPPGPKVHQVSLSPRSDFRMPDEVVRPV